MPGFNIGGQGDNVPSATVETRRKHRWAWEVMAQGVFTQQRALLVLQKAARPSFSYEEAVMHHNQEQAYFAGKQTWEPIEISWYDAEQGGDFPDVSKAIYEWLNKVTNTFNTANVDPPSSYKKESKLTMLDGQGATTETWTLHNSWPQKVNWGDLDYTNSEIQLIEVTLRFDRAIRS